MICAKVLWQLEDFLPSKINNIPGHTSYYHDLEPSLLQYWLSPEHRVFMGIVIGVSNFLACI